MTIPYKIARLETRQFAIFPEKFNNQEDVGVNSAYEFSISTDQTAIRCRSTFHYFQGENVLMILELNAFFAIAPEGMVEIQNKGSVPVDFLRYMGTIAVGAARGVIHSKTEGTVLNAVVLPPINLVEIIKEDLLVEKNGKEEGWNTPSIQVRANVIPTQSQEVSFEDVADFLRYFSTVPM